MKFDTAELTRLRQARGMTQRQLATAVGLNPSAISRIERGDRDPPATTCARLAKALGVPMEQLVHE